MKAFKLHIRCPDDDYYTVLLADTIGEAIEQLPAAPARVLQKGEYLELTLFGKVQ